MYHGEERCCLGEGASRITIVTGEIIITPPPSIWNNKNSRKISGRILRIIRRQEKFSFGDFENNKSPPQAKNF